MSLISEFEEKVRAGVSGIMIQSHEHADALLALRGVCDQETTQWEMATFDADNGLRLLVKRNSAWHSEVEWWEPLPTSTGGRSYKQIVDGQGKPVERINDPGVAVRGLGGLLEDRKLREVVSGRIKPEDDFQTACILVISNPENYLLNPAFVQVVSNRLVLNRAMNLHIVFLSATSQLPLALQRQFDAGHITHELPDRHQIEAIIERTAGEYFSKDPAQRERIIEAAKGLTRGGVEDAVALSIVRHDKLDYEIMSDLKAMAFANNIPGMEIYRGPASFDQLGGLAHLKERGLKMAGPRHKNPKWRSRGIVLLGPPGTGKTEYGKSLGNETGRPTIILKLGGLKHELQGRSFANLRNALQTVEAVSPCILFLDEIEGQISGGKNTGKMDAGTTSQMNSEFLSWMSSLKEKDADVFVVVSANNILTIMEEMPEFIDRFDRLFFMDYPERASKDEIWKIHLAGFEFIDAKGDIHAQFSKIKLPPDEMWTGRDIEKCCRLARSESESIYDLGKDMTAIAAKASKAIDEGRKWAEESRCYAAEYNGLYKMKEHAKRVAEMYNGSGRRMIPKPSTN